MATNSNKTLVPEAKASLEKFKYEVASDMCVKNIFTYLLATSFLFMLFSFLILSFRLIH